MSLLSQQLRDFYDHFVDEIRVAIALSGIEPTEKAIFKMTQFTWNDDDRAMLLVYALVRLADEVPMKLNKEVDGGQS